MDPLLAAIRDKPSDRARWLVYADRLDDTGQHNLAAAWRWMVATKRWPHYWGGTYNWWTHNTSYGGPESEIYHLDTSLGDWFDCHTTAFKALSALADDLVAQGLPEPEEVR
jgi:uncharacterized protein (TIGR02996 family)